jgi:dipeptidyl aminopeptidase/acylaminoacyl peptidase
MRGTFSFLTAAGLAAGFAAVVCRADDAAVSALAAEARQLPRICYAARSPAGDWDLYTARADGSDARNLTNTPDTNEALPHFSPDGTRLLYRRTPKAEKFDNNAHGSQGELVLSDRDGGSPRALGRAEELAWASWSPDGSQIATLQADGIRFVDAKTLKVVRTLKRQGFFQQMTWSPDGRWLIGVSNGFGASWMVARMDAAAGKANAVSVADCCTPDWFPDGRRVIYSCRPAQWTQLWSANPDGTDRKMVYAEDGRHVYGGCVSPDGKYVLFTGNAQEDGDPGAAGSPMGLMRVADGPIVGGGSAALRKQYPEAKTGPVLPLPAGWEPCWVPPDAKRPASGADRAGGEPSPAGRNHRGGVTR